MTATLIILGGLPGTGKTTIAKALAERVGAVHVRVDTIEQELVRQGVPRESLDDKGYRIAYGVAVDNLRVGRIVIADTVNPVEQSRAAWRAAATGDGAAFIEVELFCSDAATHRARVEGREGDIDGLCLPTWADVETREYEPWGGAMRFDTAASSPEDVAAKIAALLP